MSGSKLGIKDMAECPICKGPVTATRSGLVCSSGELHGLVQYSLVRKKPGSGPIDYTPTIRDFEKFGYPVCVGRTGIQIGEELRRLLRQAPA